VGTIDRIADLLANRIARHTVSCQTHPAALAQQAIDIGRVIRVGRQRPLLIRVVVRPPLDMSVPIAVDPSRTERFIQEELAVTVR